MTPEELRVATTPQPPLTEPLDYVAIPYLTLESVRWLLINGVSYPEQRIAAVRALDIALRRHLDGCPRHTRRPTGLD